MQDGAPAHTAIESRNVVQSMFRGRCVGRYLDVEWPLRSPDLTPLDFFFWRYLKDRVFRSQWGPVRGIGNLMDRILAEFQWIRENSMEHVRDAVNSFYDRLDLCIDAEGGQLGLNHR